MTKRILLLCFLHGFKGNDNTFGDFPKHLEDSVANNLPDHHVTSVVYPKYETRGELGQSTAAFLEWLKERVMELRKEHLDKPWPPNDRNVGVILVAHSMGGFVASDTLFRILSEHRSLTPPPSPSTPIFPFIQGILAFDTPYNGLARSMFVYGAFSNYSKVSSVFNVMTALSAAAPATLSRLATKRAASSAVARSGLARRSPALKTWQLIAVRTGTVGAIAAGGVAAYVHRRAILDSVRSVRNLSKEDVVQGYRGSVDALGQGLAYINRGNVGESFAWLSDHFTFVGALLKQNELNRRLERLGALRGVGVKDFYASLGENGVWSGGYFVPERTFCAVPTSTSGAGKGEGEKGEDAKGEKGEKEESGNGSQLFERLVIEDVADEIDAHMGLFKKEKNKGYERMTSEAARLVVQWFEDEEAEIWDDPKFAEDTPPVETPETEAIAKAVDEGGAEEVVEGEVAEKLAVGGADEGKEKEKGSEASEDGDIPIPDESPIDIAAAASLVPLPDNDGLEDGKEGPKSDQRQAYMRHLFGVAQQTGTNLWSHLPANMNVKLPTVGSVGEMAPKGFSMPSVSLPAMPSMPSIPSMGGLFGRKGEAQKSDVSDASGVAGGEGEKDTGTAKDSVDGAVKETKAESEGKGFEDGAVVGEELKPKESGEYPPLVGAKEDVTAEVTK